MKEIFAALLFHKILWYHTMTNSNFDESGPLERGVVLYDLRTISARDNVANQLYI